MTNRMIQAWLLFAVALGAIRPTAVKSRRSAKPTRSRLSFHLGGEHDE